MTYPPGTWTFRQISESLGRFAVDQADVEPALDALLRDGHATIHTRYGITVITNSVMHYGEQLFDLHTHKRTPLLMADATDDEQ